MSSGCYSGGKKNGKQPLHSCVKAFPDSWTGHYGFASTEQGNKHVDIFQDYFTKWPMVFAVPDRIVKLLTKEVILFCGIGSVDFFFSRARWTALAYHPQHKKSTCWTTKD